MCVCVCGIAQTVAQRHCGSICCEISLPFEHSQSLSPLLTVNVCQGRIGDLSAKLDAVMSNQNASASDVNEQRVSEIEARVRAEVEAELEQKFAAAAAAERERLIVQQREIVAVISDKSLQLKRDYESKLQQVLDEASADKQQLQEKLAKLVEEDARREQSATEHETALAAAQQQHEVAVKQLIERAEHDLEEAHTSAAEAQQRLADQHAQAIQDLEAELARQRDNLVDAEKQFEGAQSSYLSMRQQQAEEFSQRMQLAEKNFQDELELQIATKDLSANASLEVCDVVNLRSQRHAHELIDKLGLSDATTVHAR